MYDQVGSVSTIITEQLQERGLQMEEAEATLLALGVHSDTGSLTFDSATARWVRRTGYAELSRQTAATDRAKDDKNRVALLAGLAWLVSSGDLLSLSAS